MSYEKGNVNLQKEISYNLDLGYQFKTSWMTSEINLFHNWVNNYIYQQQDYQVFNEVLEEFQSDCTDLGACLPVLQSTQANAIFRGFETKTVFSLMQNHYGDVDLTLFGDYTRGTFEQGGNVPRMPPLGYGLEISFQKKSWSTEARLTRGEVQTNAGKNQSNTPGFMLLNLGTNYQIAMYHQSEVMLYASGKNMLNENIRKFAPDPGRSAEIGIRVSY